jgi:hypothetical protein
MFMYTGTGTPVASRVLGIELASVLGNIEACGSSGAATGVRRSTSTHYAVDKLASCCELQSGTVRAERESFIC